MENRTADKINNNKDFIYTCKLVEDFMEEEVCS